MEVRPLAGRSPDPRLVSEIDRRQTVERQKISERNGRLFEEEAAKLDAWAEDLKVGLEREIKDLDRLEQKVTLERILSIRWRVV